jgi:uncharacterized alkaline shock family protein YloU
MKTVLEQLMELNKKLAELEKEIMSVNTDEVECDGHCGCGCDESPVEVEDEGPEFDSAGFSEADRVETPQQANTIVFTKEELIDFAFKLMDRTVDACKEVVANTQIDVDDVVTLELGYGYNIEIELNQDRITNDIQADIINTIDLDNDSIEVEVDNVLTEMLNEKNS